MKLATDLVEVLGKLKIDALGITPSGLALLSSEAIPSCLKQITTVGEPLDQAAVEEWADKVDLRVSYGLSECAQLNFSRTLTKGDSSRVAGKPNDTTQAYILEPGTFRRLAVGTQGELCLAGPQVAQGYHNRLEQSEKSFFKNPFGPGKIYRTGDLAVRTRDGLFEILGRLDYQIKINGQRLEPGEVANAISKCPLVSSNAVVGATVGGKKSLVAALVPANQTPWSALVSQVRERVQSSLPSFMVPNYWLRLEKLPLNQNGKADISKLRHMAEQTDVTNLLAQAELVEDDLLDERHQTIRAVWAQVLDLKTSAIHGSSSFPALGGSSVDAINVVRQLRKQGIHVELSDIVRSRNLSDIEVMAHEAAPSDRPTDPRRLSLVKDTKIRKMFDDMPGVEDAYPPTQLQASLLASTLSGNDAYLYQRTYDIRHLDLVKLKLAAQIVFSASEILRTTFMSTDAGVFQVVRDDFVLPWNVENANLNDYRARDKAEGVTFGQPFVRFAILNKQILVVSMHHSLFDFWSHHFLFDDVAQLYFGMDLVQRPPFRRFVEHLQNNDLKAANAFWSSYLEHAEPTIVNPTPSTSKNDGYRFVHFDVGSTMSAMGVTSGAIIYTAWALILARHTGHDEATFATAISGRELALDGMEALDGPTLTLVPQKIDLNPKRQLRDVVQAAHHAFWDILRYSQHGMRRALSASNLQGDQILDTMVNILVKDKRADGLTKEVFQPYGPKPSWQTEWATLDVEEHPHGFQFHLVAAMPERRVCFILDELTEILNVISKSPDALIGAVDPIGEAEREWLTSSTYELSSEPRHLHDRFERIAKNNANNIALQWQNDEEHTYQQLDEMANQASAYLIDVGIQPGDLVPLLLEKSPRMIVMILAVLKAGAAYVPLSPDNPMERNDFITKEVGASFILTESRFTQYLASSSAKPIFLDTIDTSAYPSCKPAISIGPERLAYVIYTSGSTGQPKGVMIKHRAVSAAIDSIINFEGCEDDSVKSLQFSNYVFDVSVYDIFVALSSGHTLCMAPSDRLLSDLAGVINEMEVNHTFLTPTVARLLDPQAVPTLKALTVGGESVTSDVIDRWADDHQLLNGYGPTEASILTTMKDIAPDTSPKDIGRPLPTVRAFIIDPHGHRLVPWGAVGELCFAGPQLGDGYLARPEQTASSFFEYDIEGVDRLYRSGDLGRWLSNGDIECLGRKDNQTKINGFRVELGEIEHALLSATCVRDAVVVIPKVNGKSQLLAFIVLTSAKGGEKDLSWEERTDELESVKRSLKALAHYMAPKYMIPLPAMPKLPSGKVNRKALKAKAEQMTPNELLFFSLDAKATSGPRQVPQTQQEVALHEAWMSVLNLDGESFGLEADFLSLGGDSIAAINLASHMRKKGYLLSVGDALDKTNLKAMAEVLESAEEQETETSVAFEEPAVVKDEIARIAPESEVEYFYSCPPGQYEFLDQGARGEQFWRVMATRKLPSGTDLKSWLRTATRLAEVNDILRTTFRKHDGQWYGAVMKGATPISKSVAVNGDQERAQALDAVWNELFQYGHPFICYNFLHHPDESVEVVVKMDHGLYDGTQLRIFDDDFKTLQHDRPTADRTTFQEFATHLYSQPKSRAIEYWKSPDNGPTNFRFPKAATPAISEMAVLAAEDLDVDQLCQKTSSTASTVFQAAYQLWLGQRSGSQDVSFDYLYTGRNVGIANPQSINGPCANFLPLRSQLDSKQTLKEYLSKTQTRFWQATENGIVPIQQIYDVNDLPRKENTNTALFLFQPFDPPPPQSKAKGQEDMRWVVMAKSEVKMPQPYAIVFEIVKMAVGWKFKIGYDPEVFDAEGARDTAEQLRGIIEEFSKMGSGETIATLCTTFGGNV